MDSNPKRGMMVKCAQRSEAIRVLVVEDETIIAMDLQGILKQFGYEVCRVVSSGEESIRTAKRCRPDVVLMDIKLRGSMNGITAAKHIRSDLEIPVVYLTAYSDPYTMNTINASEQEGFIYKPFEERQLRKALKKALVASA